MIRFISTIAFLVMSLSLGVAEAKIEGDPGVAPSRQIKSLAKLMSGKWVAKSHFPGDPAVNSGGVVTAKAGLKGYEVYSRYHETMTSSGDKIDVNESFSFLRNPRDFRKGVYVRDAKNTLGDRQYGTSSGWKGNKLTFRGTLTTTTGEDHKFTYTLIKKGGSTLAFKAYWQNSEGTWKYLGGGTQTRIKK